MHPYLKVDGRNGVFTPLMDGLLLTKNVRENPAPQCEGNLAELLLSYGFQQPVRKEYLHALATALPPGTFTQSECWASN